MHSLFALTLLLAAPAAAGRPGYGLDISAGVEVSRMTDPFGVGPPSSFTPIGVGPGVTFGDGQWYIDFSGQLLDRSLRQRRIATTMSRMFVHRGAFSFGIEADYWELGFRQRYVRIIDTDIRTYRQGRAILGGLTTRWRGPRSIDVSCSLGAGGYTNEYDSIVDAAGIFTAEPLARDATMIFKARVGVQTGMIRNRVAIHASVRHFRVTSTHSSWIPGSEWSGDATLHVRIASRGRKSILVGAVVRFGPDGPSLVTDKTFGLRGTLKLR